ncbi:hypothetical protein DRO53_01665, partial [Candidatus Bathyarchaeota archaeon]
MNPHKPLDTLKKLQPEIKPSTLKTLILPPAEKLNVKGGLARMAETRNLREIFLEKLSETVSSNIFTFSLLTATLTAAFLLRILPAKWGIYLSGLESYWHYYVAKHMVEQGYSWIFQPQGWIDKLSWYPEGRDVAATTFLGV